MTDPITIADELKLLELDKSELVGMIRGLMLDIKGMGERANQLKPKGGG